jgi:hypothetical protein
MPYSLKKPQIVLVYANKLNKKLLFICFKLKKKRTKTSFFNIYLIIIQASLINKSKYVRFILHKLTNLTNE